MSPAAFSPMPADLLVPLLRIEGAAPDPVAIATWYLALGSAVAVEVPHELFALWLFPVSGGVVLLGPEALAADRIEVPLPNPHLLQDDLFTLEQILRRAKYPSAIAVPIRHGGRDVGVMLFGSFSRGAFGPGQALAVHRLASQLAAPMLQLAGSMPSVAPHATLEPTMTRDALPGHLARAACEAASGPDLVRRASGILYPLLPHDRLEVLLGGTAPGAYVALSGSSSRRRWSAGGGNAEPFAAIAAQFSTAPTLLVDDLAELAAGLEWAVGTGSVPARSVLGARLEVAGREVGYLLLGSVARNAYHPDDEDTLAVAALLLAPRIAGFRPQPEPVRADSTAETALPLIRAAEVLAATAHLAEGLQGFAAELHRLLPHEGISLHLRWGEDELITLDPDAPRPFADLPAKPIDSFEGAEVLRGEREWLAHRIEGGEEVLVALRVAGRIMGTLGVRASHFAWAAGAAAIARPYADVLAPHLELLRRSATLSGPGIRERTPAR